MDFVMDAPLKLCNGSRASQPCCCIGLRRYRLQGGSHMGETCKDRQSSVCKGILLYAPAAGSLLHGHVTAISKSAEKRLETIRQPAIGACGLQVWKVAQLVEQEANPSPRFDSWLSNLSRKNYKPS